MRIVGDNIILRTVSSSDLDVLFKWENDPEISKFNTNTEVISRDNIKLFIKRDHDIYLEKQLRLMITLNTSEKVIGTLDLFEYDHKKSLVGVGIVIFREINRSKKFGSEAMNMLLRYAVSHLNIKKVYCNIEKENDKSISFFKSKGFVRLPEKSSSDLLDCRLDGMHLYYFDCL